MARKPGTGLIRFFVGDNAVTISFWVTGVVCVCADLFVRVCVCVCVCARDLCFTDQGAWSLNIANSIAVFDTLDCFRILQIIANSKLLSIYQQLLATELIFLFFHCSTTRHRLVLDCSWQGNNFALKHKLIDQQVTNRVFILSLYCRENNILTDRYTLQYTHRLQQHMLLINVSRCSLKRNVFISL